MRRRAEWRSAHTGQRGWPLRQTIAFTFRASAAGPYFAHTASFVAARGAWIETLAERRSALPVNARTRAGAGIETLGAAGFEIGDWRFGSPPNGGVG